ncbi:hypothetical protein [Natrinema sp. H-ect4]|uniref:hypothetical protein n=1 Tax=Natrinema sp. H-ect4 TaxID=3242699 RepID=UPI0035A9255B
MSNEITRAVRKLRGLQEDVERLKSGRDEEGETRILRLVTDRAVISDVVSTAKDAIITDEVTVTDAISTAKDAIVTDDATVTDQTATTTATTQPAYHGEARHGIDHHSET